MFKKLSLVIALIGTVCASLAFADEKEIKIGWIGPLTGNSAVLGVDSVEAIQMAFDAVNKSGGIKGYKLKLIAEDDQYSTPKTLTSYRKLVSVDKVKFIYVITYGGLFAIADSAKRDGVIILDPLDCDDEIAALNANVMCIAKTTKSLGTLAADHAVRNRNMPIGILYVEGDPFPITTAKNAKNRLEELGVKPIVFEGYTPDTRDFRSLLLRLKSANVKSLFMYGYDEMGLLALQAKELGLEVQIYSFGTVVSPGFLSSAKGSAENAIIVMWKGEGKESLEKFLSGFGERKGRAPFVDISSLPSFDIANILIDCLGREGLDADKGDLKSDKIAKCFYRLKNYQGISGNITMDPDGITRSFTHSMSVLKGDKLEELPIEK